MKETMARPMFRPSVLCPVETQILRQVLGLTEGDPLMICRQLKAAPSGPHLAIACGVSSLSIEMSNDVRFVNGVKQSSLVGRSRGSNNRKKSSTGILLKNGMGKKRK